MFQDLLEGVPDIYKQRLHYYNTPITSDIEHADHPLSIIRSIYRPGDFIAMKLDIDNTQLETAIISAIKSDPDLIRSIGELYYEQHYDHFGAYLLLFECCSGTGSKDYMYTDFFLQWVLLLATALNLK